jgi:LPS sulfotransferase NodH
VIQPLEQVAMQISRTDQQLQYYLIMEQQETNRLLRQLLNSTKQEDGNAEIKRPELMKRMAKLRDKPQGWNKWSNEQIVEHLKGAS